MKHVKRLALTMAMLASGFVFAQELSYPAKPVVMVVAIAAGGPIDTEARLYAKKMGEFTGQSFIVDAKPGASGAIGAGHVARAAPDGHTLLVVSTTFTVTPAFRKDLPFDTLRDFAPVSQMSDKVSVLLVQPSFPVKTFEGYIEYAKANPGKINFGMTGVGSVSHLAGAWIHNVTNTKVTFVSYKGAEPMLRDLMAERVSVGSATFLVALPLIKAGKVRALAVMGAKRSPLLPGVSTIAEQGIPDYSYSTWLGISAPGATPVGVINKLNEIVVKAVNAPDIVAALTAQGSVPVGGTPAQFRQVIVAEMVRWRKVAEDAGITELE